MKVKRNNLSKIKSFLINNANSIQKMATSEHKKFLGAKNIRSEFITKYQKYHIKIVQEFAHNLEKSSLKNGVAIFRALGEKLAKDAVADGLTIEETVDGTLFLRQAVWKKLEDKGLLSSLTTHEYHELNIVIGTYCDIVSSKIAFTYHQQKQQLEKNLTYLAEASRILSSSLDYQDTLNTIAMLAVPEIGDWCGIDIVDENGQIQQLAVAHKDPKKVKWAKQLRKIRPPDMSAKQGLPNVLRTGKSELYPEITEQMLKATSKSEKDFKLLKSIGFTSAMIVPLFSQKKPIGAITFVTAETRRNYDHSDLAVAEELANRASIAIENARLYKGSQEAINIRDEFISVASHELKTPVTSVKMFTEVLKSHSEQIGDEKAVEYLSKMDRQLNKLTELIYNLLNISKIQAGRIEFNHELFDFDKVVKETVDVLQQSSSRHTIEVQGKTNKKIMGDEERIGQVINNLISNAIKYSPKSNKVLIKLSADESFVNVAVKDFGIGMGRKHLGKIFERFYRVYDNTDKTFPGLGVGLYISSEIIRRHGGKLGVSSDIGKGSTFYFSLPIHGQKVEKRN